MIVVDALAGSIAGIVCRIVTNPLDVLKIRLQLQEAAHPSSGKYRGLVHATRSILVEEGVRGFGKGGLSGIFLYISFGAAQFSSYPLYLSLLQRLDSKNRGSESGEKSSYVKNRFHGISGGLAAMTATVVSYPFDIVRTRLVAQREGEQYSSIRDAFSKLIKTPRHFYAGLVPSLLCVAPNAAVQFEIYEFLIHFFHLKGGFHHQSVPAGENQNWNSFYLGVAGAFSGICGKIAVMPFDTVKKRLQAQEMIRHESFGPTSKYAGVRDCFVQIIRKEGFRGLLKGNLPNILKAIPSSSIIFIVFERSKSALNKLIGEETKK